MARQKLELALGTIAIVTAIVVLAALVPDGALTVSHAPTSSGAGSGSTSGIAFSEVVSSNGSVLADEDGDFSDWIELVNLGEEPIDLDGHHLSDDPEEPQRWTFPDITLGAGRRLLVWASGKDRTDPNRPLHTDFSIAQDGETLVLSTPGGDTVLDRIDPVEIPRNASFGRDGENPGRHCFFERPTPRRANAGPCHLAAPTDSPQLSMPGGFYDEGFELVLHTPTDLDVYYTLDGSYPDPVDNAEATRVFDTPVPIVDRTPEPDQLSGIRTSVPDPPPSSTIGSWEGPDGPVQKATVVRARTPFSEETTATYFIGPDLVRDELPVVSLATDHDHLFDDTTGIYVPGDLYTRWHEGPDYDPEARWFRIPANFRARGREWERPAADETHRAAVFTYCEPDDGCVYTNRVGLRLHGGVSRTYPFKSFRLYARNAYGERTFDHPFFGEDGRISHRRLLLRNSGNDWNQTMLLDGYVQGLVSHLDLATQDYQPTVTFLNGEYWGIMNLRERFDQHYLSVVHDVDPNDVVMVSRGGGRWVVGVGEEEDVDPYVELLTQVSEQDMSDPESYAQVEQQLDLDDLIDYVLVETIVGNRDWPGNNTDMWRVRVQGDPSPGGPADGRWRWLLYDLDQLGGGSIDPQDDTLARITTLPGTAPVHTFGIPLLLTNLLENDQFHHRFVTRAADLLNTAFEPDRAVTRLDELEQLLADEMDLHIARWPGPTTKGSWYHHLGLLRTFMEERPDVIREQFVEQFALDGVTDLRVRTTSGGTVTMNDVPIAADTPGVADPSDWTATVFQGVPVALHATPQEGHRFVRWEGPDGSVTTDSTQLVAQGPGTVEIEAVFEPL